MAVRHTDLALEARQLWMESAAETAQLSGVTARETTREGYPVIQTTHNPEQSFMFSDRILALRGGRVLTEGGPKEVLTPELMRELYGVEVEVSSLFGDRVRVCTPASVARGQ